MQLIKELFNIKKIDVNNSTQSPKYFYNLYKVLKVKVNTALAKIFEENNQRTLYQIIFEGHSLGGAIATHAALGYKEYLESYQRTYSEHSPVLITYGAPKIGNIEFVNKVNDKVPYIFRVVHNGDAVPTIPLGNYHTKELVDISKNRKNIYYCDQNTKSKGCNDEHGISIVDHHRCYYESNVELIKPEQCVLLHRRVISL